MLHAAIGMKQCLAFGPVSDSENFCDDLLNATAPVRSCANWTNEELL